MHFEHYVQVFWSETEEFSKVTISVEFRFYSYI